MEPVELRDKIDTMIYSFFRSLGGGPEAFARWYYLPGGVYDLLLDLETKLQEVQDSNGA